MKTITLTNNELELIEACLSSASHNTNSAQDHKSIDALTDKIKRQTADDITPQMAHQMLTRVRAEIDTLIALGESYAHFQSAQATHKYLKKAKNALKGLS
jgi:hypothetical protein